MNSYRDTSTGNTSHLYLIIVIKNSQGLAIFDLLRTFFQLQLKEGVGDNTNADVNGLDVILYVGN